MRLSSLVGQSDGLVMERSRVACHPLHCPVRPWASSSHSVMCMTVTGWYYYLVTAEGYLCCSLEGNCRCGVALAMRHRLEGIREREITSVVLTFRLRRRVIINENVMLHCSVSVLLGVLSP